MPEPAPPSRLPEIGPHRYRAHRTARMARTGPAAGAGAVERSLRHPRAWGPPNDRNPVSRWPRVQRRLGESRRPIPVAVAEGMRAMNREGPVAPCRSPIRSAASAASRTAAAGAAARSCGAPGMPSAVPADRSGHRDANPVPRPRREHPWGASSASRRGRGYLQPHRRSAVPHHRDPALRSAPHRTPGATNRAHRSARWAELPRWAFPSRARRPESPAAG